MSGTFASLPAQPGPRCDPCAAPRRRRGLAWVHPQTPRQTLYVGQSRVTRLHADRLALLVEPEGCAVARVPLPRIERIVAGPMADWTGAALLACMRASVPVAFGDAAGGACGSLWPVLRASGVLDAELTLFAERRQASDAWRDGVRVLRARLLRELWARYGRAPEGALWEEQRRQFVYQGSQRARHIERVDVRCHALVSSQLRQQGVQPRYATGQGRWIEVAVDLAAALDDVRSLEAPLERAASGGQELKARAFEIGDAVCNDVVGWCLLILRRCAHAHLSPWL